MAWRAARSLLVLHQQLQAGAPRARPPATGADEWGLIGDAAHDPTSDHTPHDFSGWGSQIVTAADFPNRPDRGLDAHQVLDDIRRSHDPRVKYGISNGQMFSSYAVSGYPAWTWRPYNPKNGDRHFTHGHLSVVGDARADGTQPWATIGGHDDMQADEREALFKIRDMLEWVDRRIAADSESRTTYKDAGGVQRDQLAVTDRKSILAKLDQLFDGGFVIPNFDNDPDLPAAESTTVKTALGVASQRSWQAMRNTRLLLDVTKAIAAKVDIDPAELAEIEAAAKAGAGAAFDEHQQALIDGIVAALPQDRDGTLTVGDVRTALADVLLHGASS